MDSKKLRYVARVSLALNEPHLLIPLNDPPENAYGLLPWGHGLQVTGEGHHQEVLTSFRTSSGGGIVIGTLHITQGGTTRAPKEIVEVRLDNARIGQLTPASSQHFIPTIRHLEHKGLMAAAWVRIKGSAIAAQATLQASKAHELTEAWFAEPLTVARLRDR